MWNGLRMALEAFEAERYARLAQLGTATVHEAEPDCGILDEAWIQIIPGSRAAGPVRTAACDQGDNRAVHELLAAVNAGDVLVLTMPEPAPYGMVGELIARQAKRAAVAAILVDGGVRDTDELRELGLPVWARWVRVRGTTKHLHGRIDVPVVVGGAAVSPGDVLVLDADGAVVVPRSRADRALVAGEQRLAKEAILRAQLESGERTYDLLGLSQAVRAKRGDSDVGAQ
ncbi:MAG: 4-hydroxy-4-methyl-2-oxoglutarate aldolase [Frankiales bacterium]|nr:4-hydroxy-4-methyl-2-oxoglutarate aldolase [Frankiales bacterium]